MIDQQGLLLHPARRTVVSVGVDWGGTWVRTLGVDAKGRAVFFRRDPAPAKLRFFKYLRSLWRSEGLERPARLVLAGRGLWKKKARLFWRRRLKPLARRVSVFSDVEAAHRAAFGGRPGIIILAGTGSIAYGRNRRGARARAGGLGPGLGDEGSAFWMGKRYLERRPERARGKRFSLKETARLARVVVAGAGRRDRICTAIVTEAQSELARLVERVARNLRFRRRVTLSWAGGLMADSFFRRGVLREAKRRLRAAGLGFRPVRPKEEPVRAAALLGIV